MRRAKARAAVAVEVLVKRHEFPERRVRLRQLEVRLVILAPESKRRRERSLRLLDLPGQPQRLRPQEVRLAVLGLFLDHLGHRPHPDFGRDAHDLPVVVPVALGLQRIKRGHSVGAATERLVGAGEHAEHARKISDPRRGERFQPLDGGFGCERLESEVDPVVILRVREPEERLARFAAPVESQEGRDQEQQRFVVGNLRDPLLEEPDGLTRVNRDHPLDGSQVVGCDLVGSAIRLKRRGLVVRVDLHVTEILPCVERLRVFDRRLDRRLAVVLVVLEIHRGLCARVRREASAHVVKDRLGRVGADCGFRALGVSDERRRRNVHRLQFLERFVDCIDAVFAPRSTDSPRKPLQHLDVHLHRIDRCEPEA